ncbi:VOC family protein [Streptomyces lincolnensis]|uniref:VOC family protein n=1 Tax=Streptomyces TaxID=1883 RepID=UPI001E314EBD|nr:MULTISPECIES: VOC family protein [Streptomyces]MCD7436604.1 VOC family protein [Streptomyces lincolnensis]WLW50809.1 VOC family protein [Streptomyces coralus]
MPQITTSCRTEKPLVPVGMISHGTLTSLDLQKSRRFYEEVLGLEVIQTSPVSMLIRLGSDHTYAVVETGQPSTMGLLDHNGLDVPSVEAVDDAYAALVANKSEYGIGRVTKPLMQHGTYSFYFADCDGNWWEIVHFGPRGYAPMYENPALDITGRTDIDLDALEHTGSDEQASRPGDA